MVISRFGSLVAAVIVGVSALLASNLAPAVPLDQPAEKAVLTISGKIADTNRDGKAVFDRAMLEGLGMTSFVTSTPWYKEPMKFEGVTLDRLMSAVGASGDHLVIIALNDYSAELPLADVRKYKVILALKREGEYLSVRDKGPLFIVYDFDSDPDLRNQKFYARSVWQIARIEVR
jgi:hypothetical protein